MTKQPITILLGTILLVTMAVIGSGVESDTARLSPPVIQPARPPVKVSVGPNVQVSRLRADSVHNEVVIAPNPKDPARLLAGSMIYYPHDDRARTIVYASKDGGKTWGVSLERREDRAFDPSLTFGPDGSAYFICLNLSPDPHHETMGVPRLFRSPDGGTSWAEPLSLEFPIYSGTDRPWVAADRTSGRFRGRIYVSFIADAVPLLGTSEGGEMRAIPLITSTDGGRTFSGSTAANTRFSNGPNVVFGDAGVVLTDGTYVAPYEVFDYTAASRRRRIYVARSTDGGESFGISDRGAPEMSPVGSRREAPSDVRLFGIIPSLAADAGSSRFKDRLYLVWADYKPGEGIRVMLSRSKDQGVSWEKPAVISDIPATARPTIRGYACMPCVAVNGEGVVAVTWYDTRDLPAGKTSGWDVRLTTSIDGGETWQPSVKVTATTSILAARAGKADPWLDVGYLVGHTTGLCADADGVFHPVWIDTRTGLRQVWTAAVSVPYGVR